MNAPLEIYYVYAHKRLHTGEIFYVGKGKGTRAMSGRNRRNKHWHNIVKKDGGFDHTLLMESVNEETAFAFEKEIIKGFRARGITLANRTDGGEGASGYKHTDEVKAEQRNRMLGKMYALGIKHTVEQNAAKSKIMMVSSAWIGRPRTAEQNTAQSHRMIGTKYALGIKHTDEQRAAQSKRMMGSKIALGSKRTDEQKIESSDKTARLFAHKDGDIFTGTMFEFYLPRGLNKGHISEMVKGKCGHKSVKGWKYLGLALH